MIPVEFVSPAQSIADPHTRVREQALAGSIQDVAAELRLIDVVHLIGYLQGEKHANIADLVRSSAELYFRNDTLRYGWAGSVDLKWGGVPAIHLDMEFANRGVFVYFDLLLEATSAGVDLRFIEFDDPSSDPEENSRRLIEALQDARISGFLAGPPTRT